MRRAAIVVCAIAATAGCEKRDPLFCGLNQNDPRCVAGDAGGDTRPEGTYFIGGTVTGKMGGGLVLLNNGADDKLITSDGSFQFDTPIPMDSAYAVTVGSPPTNPSQSCTVANGTGTATGDVTNVDVTCETASYFVGGIVVGYSGGTLVLQDNNTDDKTITANGMFKFATKVASGSPYSVTKTSGSIGACSVSGGLGTVGNDDISTVVVNCMPGTFTVGGTVTGLNGMVKLSNNGGTPISISSNGSFAFPTPVGNNQAYSVAVTQQPGYPPASQNCTISGATGMVNGGNVVTVAVTCTTNKFTVGGNVTGLAGTLVLRNNGGDDYTLNASGPFTFSTPIFSGLTYAVTVFSKPVAQACLVTQSNGTIANANVTNVMVTCGDAGIHCGTNYCNAATEQCCDPEGARQCIAKSSQCSQLSLPCNNAADCGSGQRCCAMTHNGNGNVESVSCSSSCGGSNPVQMCESNTNECTSGTCSAWSKLPGYNACL